MLHLSRGPPQLAATTLAGVLVRPSASRTQARAMAAEGEPPLPARAAAILDFWCVVATPSAALGAT